MNIRLFKKTLTIAVLILILSSVALSACQPQPAAETTSGEDESTQEQDHAGGEHDEEPAQRIPNNGAVIDIISPADDATFQQGEDIVVEVEVENFDLTVEGAHWHLYVDGSVYAQVLEGPTKEVIRGLEPGEHKIETYLGLPTHEELEDGGSITITVTE
jgi:hypothetical protein